MGKNILICVPNEIIQRSKSSGSRRIAQKIATFGTIFYFLCVIPAYRQVGAVYAQEEYLTTNTEFGGEVLGKYNDLKIKKGVVGSRELKNNSVNTQDLADNSITKEKIADTAVSEEKITDNAVTQNKILDNSITTNKLADNSVSKEKIQDNAITTEKLADNSVTDQKVSDDITVSKYLLLTGGLLTGALESQGTITATSFIGDGSQLSNIQATSINPEADITVDDLTVNGNVGIGTASPGAKLHVVGSGDGFKYQATDGGGGIIGLNSNNSIGSLRLKNSTDATILSIYNAGDNRIWGNTNTDLVFATNDAERVRITNIGNVGIGTVNPTSLNNRDRVLELNAAASGSSGTPGLVLRAGVLYTNPAWEIMLGLAGVNETAFNISSGTTNVLHIRNSGNVGIGTIEPSEKLQVSGNVKADSFIGDGSQLTNIQATSINPEADITVSDLIVNGNLGIGITSPAVPLDIDKNATTIGAGETEMLRLYAGSNPGDGPYINLVTGAGKAIISSTRLALGGVHYGSDLLFKTTDNEIEDNQPTTKLRIDSAGNVGIGTTSPETKLHVHNSGTDVSIAEFGNLDYSASSGLAIRGTNTGIFSLDAEGSGSQLSFKTSASEQVRITAGGNVGIGTIEPSEKLQVSGNIKADSFIGDGSQLTNIQATSINPESDITVSDLIVNGNLGIGTANPIGPLQIDHSGDNFQALVLGDENNSSNNTGIYGRTNGVFDLNTGGAGTITFSPGGSEKVRFTSDGNVGIGTTSPAYKLDVDGALFAKRYRWIEGDEWTPEQYNSALGGSGFYFSFVNNKGGYPYTYGSIFGLSEPSNYYGYSYQLFRGYGGEGLYYRYAGSNSWSGWNQIMVNNMINNAIFQGNVGIGTVSPLFKLHVSQDTPSYAYYGFENTNASGDSVIMITGGSGGSSAIRYDKSGGATWTVGRAQAFGDAFAWNTSSDVDDTVGSNPKMVITRDGNVGIGTTGPGEKLEVYDGSIVVTETADNPFSNHAKNRLVLNYHQSTDKGVISAREGNSQNAYKDLGLGTGTGAQLFLRKDGNVGIGTTSPQAKLDVNGAIKIGSVSLDSGAERGTITFDDEFIYVKTNQGWRKARLCSLE